MNAKTKLVLVWRRVYRTLDGAPLPDITFTHIEGRIDMALGGFFAFDSNASREMSEFCEFCDFFTVPQTIIPER